MRSKPTSFLCIAFFFSSRRRHTRCGRDWSSDVCSSDLGSLIPLHKNYIQQRHVYAQARYLVLTGWKAPAAGGPSTQQLTPAQRGQDQVARQRSEERRVGKECRSRWAG